MNPDFLLTSPLARKLYHDCAKALPIIDFHNHLPIALFTAEQKTINITHLWVQSDPYKHRAMRILGVEEQLITGNRSDYEKFQAWYSSLPRLIGNPLFDWSVMELSQVFNYDLLPFKNCQKVWDTLNLAATQMPAIDILRKFNVEYIAPCASLDCDLTAFRPSAGICPSLRGDDLLLPSTGCLRALERLTDIRIRSLADYLVAVRIRLSAFRDTGCRFSDHALDNGFVYMPEDGKNEQRFAALLRDGYLNEEDRIRLSSAVLTALASEYARVGFTMQLHIGAQRTTSTRLCSLAGPTGGYAAIGSTVDVTSLTRFLDAVEHSAHGLPQILFFPLNPADNAVIATLSGSYAKDGCEALISQGPAWWWCDHYQGITAMLDTFACHSLLSTFVGMTTDSRSIVSFVRHDYFRRVLCQWMSDMVCAHRLPEDMTLLQDTVRRICYSNAKKRIGGLHHEIQ